MKNEKLINLFEKVKTILSHAGKIAIIVSALVIGFFVGEIYHRVTESTKIKAPMDLKDVHHLHTTSIAINERSELLIINRMDGTYEIYEDSIGRVIFNLYASKMYNVATEK